MKTTEFPEIKTDHFGCITHKEWFENEAKRKLMMICAEETITPLSEVVRLFKFFDDLILKSHLPLATVKKHVYGLLWLEDGDGDVDVNSKITL